MKKRIELFYKLNDQEKIMLTEKYMKSDSNNNSSEKKESEHEPNVRKVEDVPAPPPPFPPHEVVVKYPIAKAKMTIEPSSFVYDGTEKKPAVTVKDSNNILSSDDYDIAYASNIAVGTGTVTVTGKNNYTGTLSGTFEIKKPQNPPFIWILAALILTVAAICLIIFLSGNSSNKDAVTSSASQISEITSESVISTVSSRTVSEKSEDSVKTSSCESSVESLESSIESSDESVSETSVNSHEISLESSDPTEETHQPSVESSQPSVIPESSIYVPIQQSSEIIPVQESSQEASSGDDISVSADPLITGTCGDDIQYTFNTNDHTLTITGNGEMSSDFYNFSERDNIQTVLIGSNVTSICNNAFESCERLETVKMADDIETIGMNAFVNCISLREVRLSGNLEKLSSYAFNGCKSLQKITVPDKVAEIYNNTFEGCIGLKSVHLSQNITEIDDDAFTGCNKNILTIYAPKGSHAETYAKDHNIKFVAEGAAV